MGSLPVEASGLSYLRLSAPTIHHSSPRENFFDLPFFSCTLQQQHFQSIHISRQGDLTMLERLSMFKGLVLRIHMFGANRFVVISQLQNDLFASL